jgi:hypothetical protein
LYKYTFHNLLFFSISWTAEESYMKKNNLIVLELITVIVLIISFLWIGSIRNVQAEPSGNNQVYAVTPTAPLPNSNLSAESSASSAGSDELLPSEYSVDVSQPNALPTPIPGETLLYFVTADSDATATVLYLYNTDSVAHTVALRGYSYTGVLGYSLNINIAATSFLRLSSDLIAAAPPPSWATPAPIIINFTDFTYFGSLSLPKGVKVEGYVLFNPSTGTVDPRLDQGAIPLRFSTDPATVFLSLVQSSP